MKKLLSLAMFPFLVLGAIALTITVAFQAGWQGMNDYLTAKFTK